MIENIIIGFVVLLATVVLFYALVLLVQEKKRRKEDRIIMKLNDLAGRLTVVGDKIDKVALEVAALKDALSNVDLPPEAQAALDRVDAGVQGLDDLNPDA